LECIIFNARRKQKIKTKWLAVKTLDGKFEVRRKKRNDFRYETICDCYCTSNGNNAEENAKLIANLLNKEEKNEA
jgi:hypothetical protein